MLLAVATIELVWQDESGSSAVTIYRVPSSYTVEQAFNAATAVLDACSALTNAVLTGIRIKYKFSEPERLIASGSAPITDTGVFFYSTGPSTPDAGIVVHSLNPSIVLDSGPTAGYGIDMTNSDVIAFTDAIVSLPGTNPFGDELVALFAAYKQSRL